MPRTTPADLSRLLDEGTIPIPPLNTSNFMEALRMFLGLWITEHTKHRLFRWYLQMLNYIAQNEVDYGRVSIVVTSPEDTDVSGADASGAEIVTSTGRES